MEPPRQKQLARLALLVGTVIALTWLIRLDREEKISTDVLDLVPSAERAPELGLVRSLASEQQARVALFALTSPQSGGTASSGDPARAGEVFVRALAAAPEFAEIVPLLDTQARDAFGRYVYEHRFELLLPAWLEAREREYSAQPTPMPWPEWLAERVAADLEKFLANPEAIAFQDILPGDPLLLLPNLVEQVQSFVSADAPQAGAGAFLVWARLAESPLTEKGQEPVFAAVQHALAATREVSPTVELQWTAISRFAAESRKRIEAEMSGLNLLSFVAVLGVAAISVRRLPKVLHLAPVIIGSLLGAWMATTLIWDRVHVLVFVVGSLLAGVAIDYGFYLYLQPRQRAGETYREKVGRLIKPLMASSLTAITGFLLLLFSELPLIRQLGVFVSAGLLSALGTALLWFAQVDDAFLETRGFIRARLRPSSPTGRVIARGLLVLGAFVALVGPWRLQWRDDIRQLEIPAPELRANDRAVRALFGETPARTIYLTRGETAAAARSRLERFLAWHAQSFPETATATLGLALPTEEAWRALPARLARLNGFTAALRSALERHGFMAESFAQFFATWETAGTRASPTYDNLARGLIAQLRGPMALLFTSGPQGAWLTTIAEHPPGAEPPAELGTVSASQLESLNQLFSRYRASALLLSAIGLGLVGLSVLAIYGWRRGPGIFAIPLGSCLFAFGLLGLGGATLNLFHLLGAFLGVCLSHNYAIFTAENEMRGDEPPPSIRLSALATAASFAVLALSKIPVVAALGTTVALIVLTALIVVELLPLAKFRQRA